MWECAQQPNGHVPVRDKARLPRGNQHHGETNIARKPTSRRLPRTQSFRVHAVVLWQHGCGLVSLLTANCGSIVRLGKRANQMEQSLTTTGHFWVSLLLLRRIQIFRSRLIFGVVSGCVHPSFRQARSAAHATAEKPVTTAMQAKPRSTWKWQPTSPFICLVWNSANTI